MCGYFWSRDEVNDPTKDEEIPDDMVLFDLIDAAKQFDLLSPVKFKDKFGHMQLKALCMRFAMGATMSMLV
jgi:hypothetical protein